VHFIINKPALHSCPLAQLKHKKKTNYCVRVRAMTLPSGALGDMLVKVSEDADASGAEVMPSADATTGETRQATAGNAAGPGKRKGESAEAAPGLTLLSWVACDKCEKWRRLSEESLAQYEDKAFHCSYLPGVDCDTPEETSNHLVDDAALNSGKHSKVAICPSCRTPLERGQRGRERVSVVLERHYRVFPLCRPLEATTPETVASLIVDLSDRLPYRAVEHEAIAPPPSSQPGPLARCAALCLNQIIFLLRLVSDYPIRI
jgi:hypothetical protein